MSSVRPIRHRETRKRRSDHLQDDLSGKLAPIRVKEQNTQGDNTQKRERHEDHTVFFRAVSRSRVKTKTKPVHRRLSDLAPPSGGVWLKCV